MKKKRSLKKEQIEKIAEYQWANIKDIMDIGSIGRNKARNVFNKLSDEYYDGKEKVRNGLIPMDMVLDYYNICKTNKLDLLENK